MTNTEYKQKSKPWISKVILKAIRSKDKVYTKYLNEQNSIHKVELHNEYKQLKNSITTQIRTSKKIFYKKYFSENSNNSKKLWSGINEIINTKPKNNFTPQCIEEKVNGKYVSITEPKKIANSFVDDFSSVAERILKLRKYPGNKAFTGYLKNPNSSTFMLNPTDPKEIEALISISDTSKSTIPNSIPTKILKSINTSISTPIANICNKSFSTGTFPDILKISKVIPIHKKDSKLKTSNYRPISLLSNINKIIEKLMFNRLYPFLEMHNCIYELQFGFREKHSTNHALLSMTQQIKEAIDHGKLPIGVFIDFQKAFDTVNHEILLSKLCHYGIRGVPNQWFSSYLTNRKQFVSINGQSSKLKAVKHGVPQGSVLGPLLFLIYINDLHTSIKFSTTRHFADDTNLLYIVEKKPRNQNIVRNLNIDLKLLNHWLLANKISLNDTKSELIFFRKKGTSIPEVNIQLNGIKLVHSSEIKYVGIVFDEYLSFEPQIKILNAKLKRANNLLAISRHYVPKSLLTQIYYGQFYSHLSYGCQIWGQNLNKNSPTFILQKKAIRLISFADFRAHTDPLFKELKLLKIMDIVKLNNVIFVHNVLNDKAPKHFHDYFPLNRSQHDHRTVNNPNSIYSIPYGSIKKSLTCTQRNRSIKYFGSNDWNELLKALSTKTHKTDNEIKNKWMQNIKIPTLKSMIKNYIIDSY